MTNYSINLKPWQQLMASLWLPNFASLSAKQVSLKKDFDTLNARLDAQILVIQRIEQDLTAIAQDTQVIIKLLQDVK